MSGTTAFDAKKSLYDLLVARFTDLAAEQAVWYGYQGLAGQRPRECVWVGEIAWDDENGAALGMNRRDEIYRIVLTVESHVPGDDQKAANDRVETRMQAIEGLLRSVKALGVAGIYECGIVPQMLGEGADPEGRGAVLITHVRIRARI